MAKQPLKMAAGAAFTYPDTLLRAARQDGPDGLDIALLGLPYDGGTIARDGSRSGPGQMRQMSFNIRGTNQSTKQSPFETCRIADIGDAPVNTFDHEASVDMMTDFCRGVADAGAWPLAAGGDHLISLPVLRGTVDPKNPVGLVHFDAHPDTHDMIFGTKLNHATPFRRAIEEGLVDPKRHIIIGIRGTSRPTDAAMDWARDVGDHADRCRHVFRHGRQGGDGKSARGRRHRPDLPSPSTLMVWTHATCRARDRPSRAAMTCAILRSCCAVCAVSTSSAAMSTRSRRHSIRPATPRSTPSHLMFEILCLMSENRAAKGL